MSRRYSKLTRYVAAPIAVSSSVEQQNGQKSITLRGREFVTDVVAFSPPHPTLTSTSSDYNVVSTRISPTDSNLFSWLTAIAEKFEEYKFQGLAFTFEPQCTTNTTGCVGVFFDPDPTNSPPQTWATFTNTGCNTHGACWAKHQLLVPRQYYADRKQYYVPDQYVDAGATASSDSRVDPLEYFPGNVGVCSVGVLGVVTSTAGYYTTVGKLYLDYVITFQKATIDTVPRNAISGVIPSSQSVARTGKLVSPYFAQNSGSGMTVVINNNNSAIIWGVSAQGTGGTINTTVANPIPARYGDELWRWTPSVAGSAGNNALSGIIALQTQDLFYFVALNGLTAGNIQFHFENANGDVSTLSTYNQSYASTGVGVACGTIHVQAGERISLVVAGPAGALVPANSKIYFTPFTWGLDR